MNFKFKEEDHLEYDLDNFVITQPQYNYHETPKSESMMAQGNGYLGLRAVDEEWSFSNNEDLFVNGIFNKPDEKTGSELVDLADSIQTRILVNGRYVRFRNTDTYTKSLNLKTGVLTRTVISKRGPITVRFDFERFVSQSNKHVYGQVIKVTQLKGKKIALTVFPQINGRTTNGGTQHKIEGDKRRPTLESVQYYETTSESKRMMAHNLIVKATNNGKLIKGGHDKHIIIMDRRIVGFKIQAELILNKPFVVEKLMSVNTSIDNPRTANIKPALVTKKCDELHEELLKSSYSKELKKSSKIWKDIYGQFSTKIIGKSDDAKFDQLALYFSIYHMNSFVPTDNPWLSVGAKGLSGEGYQGHSFWDTEFFINPNYLYTKPSVVKNLLEYRYKGIEGARAKAAEKKERKEESNLKGAQYPWEMAWPTEGEMCPYWGQADIVTGQQVPIASRRQEIHVPADIAYAVHQYYDFTGDKAFMKKMGLEMIFDTAMFWSQRAEKQKNGSYTINDVMGPNEYKGNVNNNAYINRFAKLNLDLALKYKDEFPINDVTKALSNIPYKISFEKMQQVSRKLVQQIPNEKGIIAENDQFLSLDRLSVKPFQLLGDAGKKLFNTTEGHKRLSAQLVKQADVVLLTYLLPEFYDKDVIKKNFDFYEPVTTHDSSLSPTTYAIQAVDLRKMDLAYKLYKYSINIDLGSNMQSCNAGIHAGAVAAIWQTTVFGYGGLRWTDNQISLTPILPKQWEGLQYEFIYKKTKFRVSVKRDKFTVRAIEGKAQTIKINDEDVKVGEILLTFEVKKEWN